jgi:hypothetical protein
MRKPGKKPVAAIPPKVANPSGRGRPREMTRPVRTSICIEQVDLDAIDAWAELHSLPRGQAIVTAIRRLTRKG